MDADALPQLARLIRAERVAALGTLRGGAPLASMVLYLPDDDFSAFSLHISDLAWHTRDLGADPRASLSIAQADDGRDDPQTLARLSLRGEARRIANDDPAAVALRARWLARFPRSTPTFALADFSFWRIGVRDARFVAGLGRIHNLSMDDLARGARI